MTKKEKAIIFARANSYRSARDKSRLTIDRRMSFERKYQAVKQLIDDLGLTAAYATRMGEKL